MKLPSNKQWTQINEGEVTGVINTSSNISLDTIGQLKQSRKPVALTSSDTHVDFGYGMSIVWFDGNYQVVTDDSVYKGKLNGEPFTLNTGFSPTTFLGSDAVVFNDLLVVSKSTNLDTLNTGGSASTSVLGSSLTSGVPHPLATFGTQLAIGNGNKVRLVDTSYVTTQTLILGSEYQVTSIRTRNNFLYIGTKNTAGGEARVFIWNGSSASFDYECPVGAEWVFSLTEYGTSVAAVTSAGQIGSVSGNTFTELASFPVYHMPHVTWQGSGGLTLNGKVFNRGMQTIGSSIYINIEGDTDTGFSPAMKSGLWVYEPTVGLYHRGTPTTDMLVNDNAFSITDNEITTNVAHNLKTGDAVQIKFLGGVTGLIEGTTYYVTVTGTDTIKLSFTREGVRDARYVELSGTVTTDTLVYFTNSDNGNTQDVTSGAILQTSINDTPLDMLASEVMFCNRTKDPAGELIYTLNGFSDNNTISSVTTQRVYSDNITQTWQSLYNFVDGLLTDEDSISLKINNKYQSKVVELSAVWLDASTINSTDATQNNAWSEIQIGDEIVFTDGLGQGRTAHVTEEPTKTANTYSLKLDESFGVANQPVIFYRTNFKKVGTVSKDSKKNEYTQQALLDYKNSPYIKLKLEIRGAGLAVNVMELSNVIHSAKNAG